MQVIPNTHVFQNQPRGNAPEQPKITPAMIRKCDDLLQKTAVNVILDDPFFAVLLLRQERKADPKVKTMVTNGKVMRYNPAWVAAQSKEVVKFTMLSCVSHCILHHNTRKGKRDDNTWERACDLKVNQMLKESGYWIAPDAPLDSSYDDLSAEEVYAKLYIEPPDNPGPGGQKGGDGGEGGGQGEPDPDGDQEQDGDGDGNQDQEGSGGYGDVENSPAESQAELAQEEAEQDIATQQAAQCAKAQGKLPGSLAKLLTEMLEPKVNWRDELREFLVSHLGKDDQSWNRCNRRFIGGGSYLPGYISEQLPPIMVAIDTSGSVSQRELDQFNGELNAIMADFPGVKMEAVYCDTRITDIIEYSDEVPFGSVQPKVGRGGTDFNPPFIHAEKRDEPPTAMIYLTDGEAPWPKEPTFPTLWVITSKHIKAPWGRTVPMEVC